MKRQDPYILGLAITQFFFFSKFVTVGQRLVSFQTTSPLVGPLLVVVAGAILIVIVLIFRNFSQLIKVFQEKNETAADQGLVNIARSSLFILSLLVPLLLLASI